MSEQSEALRLADALEMSSNHGIRREAAIELRRLHAEVEEQCRLNGMGSEREARLMAENEALRAKREPMNEFDALRLITESIGRLQSAGPVEGLIGIIRAVEQAHGIKERT